MKSSVGRPRRLTDEQVAKILAWHEEICAWKAKGAHLKSLRQFARDLGVSPSTVLQVIHSRGSYKKSSPDLRKPEAHEHWRRVRLPRVRR
jgi:transposase